MRPPPTLRNHVPIPPPRLSKPYSPASLTGEHSVQYQRPQEGILVPGIHEGRFPCVDPSCKFRAPCCALRVLGSMQGLDAKINYPPWTQAGAALLAGALAEGLDGAAAKRRKCPPLPAFQPQHGRRVPSTVDHTLELSSDHGSIPLFRLAWAKAL